MRTSAPLNEIQHLKGKHVIQRIPSNSKRRQTSSVTVAVMDAKLVEQKSVNIDGNDIRVDRYRGHGAGGQHRNKVSTAVRVVHEPTGIVITRESGRSQKANLDSAMRQLEEELLYRAQDGAQRAIDSSRADDVTVDTEKAFTYNAQRSSVTLHRHSGKRDMKSWMRGGIITDMR